MSPKKNSAKGVLFQTPIQPGLFSSKNYVTDSQTDLGVMPNPPQPKVKLNQFNKTQREGSNEGYKSPGASQIHRERLSCSSISLQAKIKEEYRQKRERTERLLNTENGLRKELEKAVSEKGVAQRRRKELLHKQWTERQWTPLQKHLSQRMSSCAALDIHRRQSSYNSFLQHCNRRGYVFLDTFNLQEYDPFFQPSKESHDKKRAREQETPSSSTSFTSTKTMRRTLSRIDQIHSDIHRCSCRFPQRSADY